MNVILLSGGSGKRLWPLSNEVRSKQFIRLFRDAQGNEESMVQRVYRQITTVAPEAKITIATSKSQVSAIRNQLGDKVSVCVEPCRRDTFPAIVLAAAYLHDEQGVNPDEGVAVCPVDPFVENEYYEVVEQMIHLAQESEAGLTLMGVEPTCPSEKYGYIIPETKDSISRVLAFKEKPDKETAKGYIAQGALWNGGVFAFRLGYLLAKAHSLIDFTDYHDLYKKYETLPKISFDYAVAEKEPRIQVIRYAGDWKDVGTWNIMTEVMADAAKGNVTLDEVCENTQVVNELGIPILCMGCKNMVIAASRDGILVADKERSGAMKPYVDRISTAAHFAEKSWGTFTVIDAQRGAMTVKMNLRAGAQLKYHSHELRNELWSILSGEGEALVDGMRHPVQTGDVITMAAGCKHKLIAHTSMQVIEIQIGEEISKADKQVFPLELEFRNGTDALSARG